MTPPVDAAALDGAVERLAPRYVDALVALVRCPSTIGEERAAQDLVAGLAREAGFEVDLWEVDRRSLAGDPRVGMADGGDRVRPNVTAVRSGTGGGRSLILNGHVDVVPPGPNASWTKDPFSGEIDGGRLYGRGALDMKGGLVAAIHAAHAVALAGERVPGDLIFESVIEEEATGNGTLAARLRGPDADAAIITELTGEEIEIANPGVLWLELAVSGRSAYVGRAGAGINAIDQAMTVVDALRSMVDDFNSGFRHPAYEGIERPLTLNVGTVEAGDWPSSVPLECRVGLRLSFPIGWSVEQAQAAVMERIHGQAHEDPWLAEHPPAVRWHGFQAAGWSIDRSEPIVSALAAAVRATGGRPTLSPMLGTADARFFGDAGIPAAYFGPSGGGQHGPDEFVELASCLRVARVLARLITSWCGG